MAWDPAADALLLPKVESAATVRQAEALMQAAGAPETLSLWCMIETPMGVLRAEEIAGASPRLGGFVMGTSDLAKDLHSQHTAPTGRLMLTSLGWCILVARAYGLAILDGVHIGSGGRRKASRRPAARAPPWASTARP